MPANREDTEPSSGLNLGTLSSVPSSYDAEECSIGAVGRRLIRLQSYVRPRAGCEHLIPYFTDSFPTS